MATRFPLFLFALMLLAVAGCGSPTPESPVKIRAQAFIKVSLTTPFSAHIRGLEVLDKNTIWVSGTGSNFGVSTDGGDSWHTDSIPGSGQLDFRDIVAFDAQTALVLSAGFPGKIYKTTDGGLNWTNTYTNLDSAVFFDGIEFWDAQNGIAFGDPIDGKLLVIRTNDGGNSWQPIDPDLLPEKLEEEAGFAASGTGIVVKGTSEVWIGLGGSKARIFYSNDKGDTWTTVETPMYAGTAARGIYSMAFKNELEGIAVGGAWDEENPPDSHIYTTDGGKTWGVGKGLQAYHSGSCFVKEQTYLATGTSGTDMTTDGGKNWKPLDPEEFNAIQMVPNSSTGFVAGKDGNMAKIKLSTF